MSRKSQLICTWTGPIGLVLIGLGLGSFAGLLPPPSPSLPADQTAALYADNLIPVRIGVIIAAYGACFIAAFYGQLAVLIKRMEGPRAQPLMWTQLIAGTLVTFNLQLAAFVFGVAAFEPTRSAEITQSLSDNAFLLLIMPAMPLTLQCLATGFAILGDRNDAPILPRWSGYLTLIVAAFVAIGCLAPMFETGPLAWNGMAVFWLAAGLKAMWIAVLAILMFRAIPPARLPDKNAGANP